MMTTQKIVVPVDFSRQSVIMAHRARALATGEVVAIHAVLPFEIMTQGFDVPGAVVVEWYAAQKPILEKRLAAFCAEHLAGVKWRSVVTEGEPAHEIVRVAKEEAADLVVMSTHGHGTFRRLILGSITAKVLHDCPSPVLTGVHLAEPASHREFNVVLAAVDGGPQTAKVLAAARAVAPEVLMVHVGETLPEGVSTETLLIEGEPAKVIRQVALARKVDLVVIGRHADDSLRGRLTTQAYAIIRESPCPVLSV